MIIVMDMDIAADVVRVGRALGDPTRVRLLVCLARRDLCVCELVQLVDVGQPAVSRHLRILREAGLVEDVRDGQFVNYRLLRPARTTFGDVALGVLLDSYQRDTVLREVAQRARVVDRARL